MLYKASAPGSLMLLGEYAVLANHTAVVGAIDQRISVTLSPRQDQRILIHSALGHYQTNLTTLSINPPFEYLLATIDHLRSKLSYGCELNIEAEFSSAMGLGSSAAVTVATLLVLHQWLALDVPHTATLTAAIEIIRRVQQRGSGADAAASLYGGLMTYQQNTLAITQLPAMPEITVVYSGSKLTTTAALAKLAAQHSQDADFLAKTYQNIDSITQRALKTFNQADWLSLGALLNAQHQQLINLNVSTPLIEDILSELRQQPGITGAKISGSGLGDCVIAIGKPNKPTCIAHRYSAHGVRQLPINFASTGALNHAD